MNEVTINLSIQGGLNIKYSMTTLRCIFSDYANVLRNMHPYEAYEIIGASEFLPAHYGLDTRKIYRFYGARTQKQKNFIDGTIIALFEKMISLMEKYPHGMPYLDVDKILCRKEMGYFEELRLLGMLGVKEASDSLDELVLFVDMDSFFLTDSRKTKATKIRKTVISSDSVSLLQESGIPAGENQDAGMIRGGMLIIAVEGA